MANVYGALKTNFKPFTFEEMLKPALMATEAHNELAENISNLEVIVGDLEHKITQNPKDKKLRELHDKYTTELQNASNLLLKNGLTPEIRNTFNTLKKQYSTQFGGVEEAYKALVSQNEYLRKLAATNPEIIVEGAGDSLSDFMGGNTPELRSVNLEKITSDIAAAAKAESLRNVRFGKWERDANGRLLTQVNKIGLTTEEFNTALLDYLEGRDTPYANIVGSIYESGINMGSSLQEDGNIKRVHDAVMRGLQRGFAYSEDRKSQTNPGWGRGTSGPKTPPPPKDIDYSELNNHDFGNLIDSTTGKLKREYVNLLARINSGIYSYNGKNPLAIYEEIQADPGSMLPHSISAGTWMYNASPTATFYKEKGIPTLSKKEYEMLQELGYTSSSTSEDFSDYEANIDSIIKRSSPSRVELDNYTQTDIHVQNSIDSWVDSGTSESKMFEHNSGKKGVGLKRRKAKNFRDAKIEDITYSATTPDVILVKTDKGSFYMSPEGISQEAWNLVHEAKTSIGADGSNKNRNKVQELTTYMLREHLRSFQDTGTGIK